MEVLMGFSVLCVVLGANWAWKLGEKQGSLEEWQRQLKKLVSKLGPAWGLWRVSKRPALDQAERQQIHGTPVE